MRLQENVRTSTYRTEIKRTSHEFSRHTDFQSDFETQRKDQVSSRYLLIHQPSSNHPSRYTNIVQYPTSSSNKQVIEGESKHRIKVFIVFAHPERKIPLQKPRRYNNLRIPIQWPDNHDLRPLRLELEIPNRRRGGKEESREMEGRLRGIEHEEPTPYRWQNKGDYRILSMLLKEGLEAEGQKGSDLHIRQNKIDG